MPKANVTFNFAESSVAPASQLNVNFANLLSFVNGAIATDTFTALSASDVVGPAGHTILILVRDSTNGGNALVLYEAGQTPVIVSSIAGAGTTFVGGVPGANQIGVKDNTTGVLFRANGTTNNAVLKTVTLIAEA